MGLLSYRAATDADVPLLVGWHADPEVSRYWDGETFTEDELSRAIKWSGTCSWNVVNQKMSPHVRPTDATKPAAHKIGTGAAAPMSASTSAIGTHSSVA